MIDMLQSYKAYYENGRVITPNSLPIPNGSKVIITVVELPPKKEQSPEEWLEEFHKLLDASDNEELRFEDFPRSRFGRELVDLSDEVEV